MYPGSLNYEFLCLIADVVIGFEHTSYIVEESAGMIQLTVDIGRTNRPISISYSTLDDTAIGEILVIVLRIFYLCTLVQVVVIFSRDLKQSWYLHLILTL